MPKTPAVFAGGGLALKTCGEPVCDMVISVRKAAISSTDPLHNEEVAWKKRLLFPSHVHKFCVQFYPRRNSHFTDVATWFSPLSTVLIIRTIWVKEENQLIGQRG